MLRTERVNVSLLRVAEMALCGSEAETWRRGCSRMMVSRRIRVSRRVVEVTLWATLSTLRSLIFNSRMVFVSEACKRRNSSNSSESASTDAA